MYGMATMVTASSQGGALGAEERARLIRGHFLFSGIEPRHLDSLVRTSRVQRLARGEILFRQGDEGGALYAVHSGAIRISVSGAEGKELTLALMEPGDVFGEIALLDGLARTADARAVERTELVVIHRADFLALLEREPKLARPIIEMLCERLRQTNEFVIDAAFLDLRARLAKRLLSLAIAHGQETDDGMRIGLKLSQSEIAQLLGVTREAVNKQLNAWSRDGVLTFESGHVTLMKQDILQALAAPH
jgi:CRP-like cAMP-binding protein